MKQEKLRSKAPTMKDVAEAARVSVATVSAVVNGTANVSGELTRRIEGAIRDIGYTRNALARSLRLGTTRTIGLTVPHIGNPFFTDVVSVIQQAFNRAGYAVMLCCTDEDLRNQDDQIRLLLDRAVDGLIVTRVGGDAPLREILRGTKVPVVLLDRLCEGVTADSVVLDNRRAVFEAISYLIGLGHRRIGYLSVALDIPPIHDRLEGYRDALAAAGIDYDAGLVRVAGLGEGEDYASAMRILARHEAPSALFTANSPLVIGAMRAIRDIGLNCPEDISVACFDDFPWSDVFRPRLTTVSQPVRAIGEQAAKMLMDRLGEGADAAPRRLVLQGRLVIRNSCQPFTPAV